MSSAVKQDVEHGLRGAAAHGVAITVERVLADIEVERRQIAGGELEKRPEDALKVVFRIPCPDGGIEFREAVKHPAFEFGYLGGIDRVRGVEVGEIAEKEPEGIPEPAVAVGGPFH